MGDGRAGGVQALQLGVLQPDAVAEHGAPAAQSVVIVDVEIIAPIGEQLLDPGDFVRRLGEMGLHQAVRDVPATGLRPPRAARASWCRRSAA